MLGFEGSNTVEVVRSKREAESTVVLTSPMTRKNPRLRLAKAPFEGGVRRLHHLPPGMLIRQAVVPNVIDCHRAAQPASP
jgi:hypothetical protein